MIVSGVLFVLFDIVATMFVVGVIARLAFARRSRHARTWPAMTRSARSRAARSHTYSYRHPDWMDCDASFARHPAGRSRKTPDYGDNGRACPKGPDDDPDFLRVLEQRLRETRGESTD